MEKLLKLLAIASVAHASAIKLCKAVPEDASDPIPEAFVSYSIELSSFPDFAGTSPTPQATQLNPPNIPREQFIPQYLLRQLAEQSRELHGHETAHSSWRKHPRLCPVQRQPAVRPQRYHQPLEIPGLPYHNFHWAIFLRILQHMAQHKIQSWIQHGSGGKQFSRMGNVD